MALGSAMDQQREVVPRSKTEISYLAFRAGAHERYYFQRLVRINDELVDLCNWLKQGAIWKPRQDSMPIVGIF
jgi:hypothetical protein